MKNKLFLILVNGPTGAGKTTVSKILHGKLKRTSHIGIDRVKTFISDFKRTPADNEISRNIVRAMVEEYFKQGINVIVDEPMTKERAENLKKIAKKYDADYFFYQIEASKSLVQQRVSERAKISGKKRISKARVDRNYGLYVTHKSPHATIFNSEDLKPQQIANAILKEVKKSNL